MEKTSTKKCPTCMKEIPEDSKSKYCSVKCGNTYRERKRRGVLDHFNSPRECLICRCNFFPKKVDSKTCDKDECKKAIQTIYNRKCWDRKTPEQRREKHLRLIEYGTVCNRRETDIRIMAKCPGCGKMHIVSFPEPGWTGNGTPRIRCVNFPYCARKEYEYDCDETAIPEIYESCNRAIF